jgi:ribosomal protein S18 acetylase RimI-like enzyme
MIDRAQVKDSETLGKLVNSAYRGDSSRQGWTTEADLLDGTRTDTMAIEEMLQKPETTVLVYRDEGRILGCVELRKEGQKLYLGMLTVQPGLQGKGLGKKLLFAAEEEASRQNCTAIFMTVISVRSELIAWYVRHGYHDTGIRKPFEVPNTRWGIPKQKLEFAVLEKSITKFG